MDLWTALLLGIVEGVTEFLPVSSTGHLILAAKLLGQPETDFSKSFKVAIQLGAIFSVVVLYWRSLLVDFAVVKRIVVAFVPTGILGLLLYKRVRALLDNDGVVLVSLAIGGVVLILFELLHREKERDGEERLTDISYFQCVLIGLCQSVAMIPGVSRSAATILGGLALGLRRKTIVEFSFLLAVPTIAAATGKELYENSAHFSGSEFVALGVGLVVSFVVALISIGLLLRYIKTHTFIAFGVYRIVLAAALWFVLRPSPASPAE
jgi:undecaprenyl-diphosphatase